MAEFPKNPQRLTPYPNFRFKIKFNGTYVAGVSRISGLVRKIGLEKHRSDDDLETEHLAPGQTEFSPITLERGISYDPSFEQWASKVFDVSSSQSTANKTSSVGEFRRNLVIEVYNEAGQLVLSYNVYNAWVSGYQSVADLDAEGSDAFVLESLILQNEGWERDISVQSPKEPSFTDP